MGNFPEFTPCPHLFFPRQALLARVKVQWATGLGINLVSRTPITKSVIITKLARFYSIRRISVSSKVITISVKSITTPPSQELKEKKNFGKTSRKYRSSIKLQICQNVQYMFCALSCPFQNGGFIDENSSCYHYQGAEDISFSLPCLSSNSFLKRSLQLNLRLLNNSN